MMSTEKHIYSMMIFFHFLNGEICGSTLVSHPDALTCFLRGNIVKIDDNAYVIKDVASAEILISVGGPGVETRLVSLV